MTSGLDRRPASARTVEVPRAARLAGVGSGACPPGSSRVGHRVARVGRVGRSALRPALAGVIVAATGIGIARLPATERAVAQVDAQADTAPALGLAHVDLMDLHVERLSDGGVRDRELLPAADLADRFARARAVGAGWNRWSLYWDMVERSGAGAFDWRAADGIVARDVAAGLRSLVILQGTPGRYATGGVAWGDVPEVGGGTRDEVVALDAPGPVALESSPPGSLDAPIFLAADGSGTDDPAGASAINPGNPWARFVAAAVARYRPGGELARVSSWPARAGVRTWEVGNEPNLSHFWSGTPGQFARLLEVAYLTIQWVDPGATVVHGGIADASGAATWYGRFLSALRDRAVVSPLPEAHGFYFDAAAWHWYAYPDLLATGPVTVRQLLAAHGIPAKPIWVTEMGVPIWSEHPGPCWDPTSPYRATTPEQAAYVWQAFAEGVAAGVQVMVLFQLYDDCGNGPASYDVFGLVRNHASNQCWIAPGQACWRLAPALAGTTRPAFDAARVVAGELAGAQVLWRPPEETGSWQRVLFYRPPDTRVTMAWNRVRGGRDVDLAATGAGGTVLELDRSGAVQSRQIAPSGGTYRITLAGATNRNSPGSGGAVMAGSPVIVVERDDYPPFRAQIEPLPAESQASLDLVVSAADGGTGISAVQVHVRTLPSAPGDPWQPASDVLPWTATPRGGRQAVRFAGRPGQSYEFAATARDRAGNWTAPPSTAQATTRIAGTPDAESPTPSRTPPAASPTSSATTASARSPMTTPTGTPDATPGPPVTSPRGYLPAVLGRMVWATAAPSPTVTATSTPTVADSSTPTRPAPATTSPPIASSTDVPTAARSGTATCVPVAVPVHGPRGERIDDPLGTWTLRAYGDAWPGGMTARTQAVGAAACLEAPANRLEAWAQVPGYIVFAPQNLALAATLHLAVAPNALVNGTFEGGLAGWSAGGDRPALPAAAALSGSGAAVLGEAASGSGGAGTIRSTLAQDVRVPSGAPVVSFEYRVSPRCADGACGGDALAVLVGEQDGEPTALAGVGAPRADTDRWAHAWYDLSAWAGRRVRLTFEWSGTDTSAGRRVFFDNVAIAPAAPVP